MQELKASEPLGLIDESVPLALTGIGAGCTNFPLETTGPAAQMI